MLPSASPRRALRQAVMRVAVPARVRALGRRATAPTSRGPVEGPAQAPARPAVPSRRRGSGRRSVSPRQASVAAAMGPAARPPTKAIQRATLLAIRRCSPPSAAAPAARGCPMMASPTGRRPVRRSCSFDRGRVAHALGRHHCQPPGEQAARIRAKPRGAALSPTSKLGDRNIRSGATCSLRAFRRPAPAHGSCLAWSYRPPRPCRRYAL